MSGLADGWSPVLTPLFAKCGKLSGESKMDHMRRHPPLRLFGQVGLGHCASRMALRWMRRPLGQASKGGWKS